MEDPTDVVLDQKVTQVVLGEIDCDYCRAVLRSVLTQIRPDTVLPTAHRILLNGQIRVLAHTATGHPEGTHLPRRSEAAW